jgi:hypothetical protein
MQYNQKSNNRLNEDWFSRYWDSILRDSGVRKDDVQNSLQLAAMTLKVIDDTADSWFTGLKDSKAANAYDKATTTNGRAHERVAFLAEWNSDSTDILEAKLLKFREVFVMAGKKYGRLRFFMSPCCSQPLEINPNDGRRICSHCGRSLD